jgi:hypothetical protein
VKFLNKKYREKIKKKIKKNPEKPRFFAGAYLGTSNDPTHLKTESKQLNLEPGNLVSATGILIGGTGICGHRGIEKPGRSTLTIPFLLKVH